MQVPLKWEGEVAQRLLGVPSLLPFPPNQKRLISKEKNLSKGEKATKKWSQEKSQMSSA
jgi:hypothetical protein